MSEDNELEKIKQQMLEKIIGKPPKPRTQVAKQSVLQAGVVNILTDLNFDQAVSSSRVPLLVDFWAEWCAPCKMMAPVIETLAREYSGRVNFAKLNTDQNRFTATRYQVMSIPNFVIFNGGKVVDRVIGAVGRQGLETVLKRHLS